jgi:hypothetical protein
MPGFAWATIHGERGSWYKRSTVTCGMPSANKVLATGRSRGTPTDSMLSSCIRLALLCSSGRLGVIGLLHCSSAQSVAVGGARCMSVVAETGNNNCTQAVWRARHGTEQLYVSAMRWITWDSSLAFSTAMLSPLYSRHTQPRYRPPLAPSCVSAYL